jgi:hypothetical protein
MALTRKDIKTAWESGELEICSKATAMREGFFPNFAGWFKGDPNKAHIIYAYQSQRDCALGVVPLDRALAATTGEAWIVLLRGNAAAVRDDFVDAAPASFVRKAYCTTPPISGPYGQYWWIQANISDVETIPF